MNDSSYTSYTAPDEPRRSSLRLIIIIFVLLLLLVIVVNAILAGNRSGKVGIAVHVLPTNAKVTMNGESIKSGTAYLKQGTYTVHASANGFADYTGTYSVDPSVKDPVLSVSLTPVSDAAKAYYKNNQELYLQQESYGGQESAQQSSLITKKSPITKVLPYSNLIYTIGYRADPDDPTGQTIIIEIDATTGFRNAAVNQIRKLGFDPTDYKINFRDYVNPFTQ